MPRFSYVAIDIDGTKYRGQIEAVDKKEVRATLRQRGFYVTSVRKLHEWSKLGQVRTITSDEIAVLAEELSVMVDAGLSIDRCLSTLSEQTKNLKLKQILDTVKKDLENGVSFADALAKHPKVFSNLFVSLVRAGEIGGVLSKSLRQIADYLNSEREIRQKVKSTLTYPKIVVGLAILVVIFVVTYLVPKFMALYSSLNIQLPLPTRMLIWASKFVPKYWWLLLGIGGGTFYGYKRLKRWPTTKAYLDRLSMKLPLFGNLIRKVIVARFIKVLAALTSSGVPMIKCLEVASQVANNAVMDEVINQIKARVNEGGGLKEPMAKSGIFPPIVVQMVSVGEEVGTLGEALEKSASYLDREIENTIKRLMAKIEPATTIIIAGVVGFMLIAIYLPVIDVVKVAQTS